MPNLAGIYDMRSSPCDVGDVLRKFSRILDVPGVDYVVRSWRDERCGAVNLLNGVCGNLQQPVTYESDIVLFLDGEIYNLEEISDDLSDTADVSVGPAQVCLQLFLRLGDDFVKNLNGQFNILVYDRPNHCVKVFNDRVGYRPFYYLCADGLACFGNEVKAIGAALGGLSSFEPMSILEFMTFGHTLNQSTLFKGIRALSQGSVLEFKDGRASERHYWRPIYGKRRASLSLAEASRELGNRLNRAVERRAKSPRACGIFLSGGLDSRAVAGALARVRRDVTSFTWGPDGFPDFEFGRQLATRLGFAFHRITYDDVSLAELLPRVVWRTEGTIPFNISMSIARHREIATHASVIFNGHFGGPLSGSGILPGQFFAHNARQLVDHILAKRTSLRLRSLQAFFRKDFLDDAYLDMKRGIEETLIALGEERLPLAYNIWDMTARQPRITFSSSMVDRYIFEPVAPLTDNDLVDFMLSVPLRYLFARTVYKSMIRTAYRELAAIPVAKTRRPLSKNRVFDLMIYGSLFVEKRMRGFGLRTRMPSKNGDAGDLEAFVNHNLQWDVFPDDVFDRDGLRKTITAALAGTGPVLPLFSLITLAECGRLFTSGAMTEPPPDTLPDI